jgi:purine-nucleoside phosphorylase
MMQLGAYEAAREAGDFLAQRHPPPPVAVVLGSGLGAFADSLEDAERLTYAGIPHFPMPHVQGHAGELVLGHVADPHGGRVAVAALSGRVHVYEGHPLRLVVHAVRAMHAWGVKAVVFTNAAGGIDPAFSAGDLMLLRDHINLMGCNPLTGPNDDRLGVRFPDMSAAYDPALGARVREAAGEVGVTLREGVYAAVMGPSYETPAEIRMLGLLGAGAVGMSTVPEVVAARHVGLRVAAISCITNLAAGIAQHPLSHDEVKETAERVRPMFVALLRAAVPRIAAEVER